MGCGLIMGKEPGWFCPEIGQLWTQGPSGAQIYRAPASVLDLFLRSSDHLRTSVAKISPHMGTSLQLSGCIFLARRRSSSATLERMHTAWEEPGEGVGGEALAHCPSACQVVPQFGYLEVAKTLQGGHRALATS